MPYFNFQFKKILKDKLTLISFVIVTLILCVVFLMNKSTAPSFSLENEANQEISYIKHITSRLKKDSRSYRKNSDIDKENKLAIKNNKKIINQDHAIITATKENNWYEAYKIRWKQEKKMLLLQTKSDQIDPQLNTETRKNILFYDYLKKHPIPYENQNMPITGWQFLFHINAQYLPYLLIIVLVFLLSMLFTSGYRKQMNLSTLIPLSDNKLALVEVLTGITLASVNYLLINLILFILATFFSGTGTLSFPYITYSFINNEFTPKFVSTGSLIFHISSIQLLVLIFLVILVRFLATIFHEKLPTILIAVLSTLGVNIAIQGVSSLQLLSTWLPMTYLNAVNVTTGYLGYLYHNPNLNYKSGIITLLSNILILSFVTEFIRRFRRKKYPSFQ